MSTLTDHQQEVSRLLGSIFAPLMSDKPFEVIVVPRTRSKKDLGKARVWESVAKDGSKRLVATIFGTDIPAIHAGILIALGRVFQFLAGKLGKGAIAAALKAQAVEVIAQTDTETISRLDKALDFLFLEESKRRAPVGGKFLTLYVKSGTGESLYTVRISETDTQAQASFLRDMESLKRKVFSKTPTGDLAPVKSTADLKKAA